MNEAELLPKYLLDKASLRGNEYAWRPEHITEVVKAAQSLDLANLGGQPQFRLPDGSTCEIYWIEIDSAPQNMNEVWGNYVVRSAKEVLEKFDKVMNEVNFSKEAQEWDSNSNLKIKCSDNMNSLYFVLYFQKHP